MAASPTPAPIAGAIRQTYPVLEMSCAACAVSVESMLKHTPGVVDAGVNYANQSAWVQYDPAVVTPAGLQTAVQSIGYDLVLEADTPEGPDPWQVQADAQAGRYRRLKQRTIWAVLLSVPVVVLGMLGMNWPYANYIMLALSAPVVFWLGRSYFAHAWQQARHGRANMDTLVALSTGIAFLFSAFNTLNPGFWLSRGQQPHVYFEAAAVIIAFVSLGKLLEERAKSNTGAAIKNLVGLQPDTVHLIEGDTERELPVSAVRVGQVLLVRPGERIAVDGEVLAGASNVDESLISGEPVPVRKGPGDAVFAGTINQTGSFRFVAGRVGADTVLARIIRAVQDAQGSKAPVQKLVDRVAGIFVPVVLGIALLTFLGWLWLGTPETALTTGLLTAVTVLVIACPCALGLATPTAIMVGIGKGAEANILIKDAESLELGSRVDTVVLDKTGTLTQGKPVVTDQHWLTDEAERPRLMAILLALETQSEHPLANAVVESLQSAGVVAGTVDAFTSQTGQGVTARVGADTYLIGNRSLLTAHGLTLPATLDATVGAWEAMAKTVVFFARAGQAVLAVLAIADPIKPTARDAVARLQDMGLTVVMLTGDTARTAQAVAGQVGITDVQAGVLPADKARFVADRQQAGHRVAMVGDGINDAPALAQADVSMAMGQGSDLAMDVARMTLIGTDLQAVPRALTLARQTVRVIRQNLFWAFIYNLIGIPVAAGLLYPTFGFLLSPMIASAAMALSSVSVVGNSLRLRAMRLY
ncbi:heavy metal translocating P-type ATPase [Spirosoma luteolum]